MKLLNIDQNAKTVKGQKKGYMTAIMYLAPYNLSGYQVCPMASKGCAAACLNTAGRGAFSTVQKSRIEKTRLFFQDRSRFMELLVREIRAFLRLAEVKGFIPVVRLNGTSDIRWETVSVEGRANVMELFPSVQFYDYTKIANRKNVPDNYHLTFSLAEDNDDNAKVALSNGISVAAVFNVKNETQLPKKFFGRPVVNGDESDLRFLDKRAVIVGLKAKGRARKDTSGFVREVFA